MPAGYSGRSSSAAEVELRLQQERDGERDGHWSDWTAAVTESRESERGRGVFSLILRPQSPHPPLSDAASQVRRRKDAELAEADTAQSGDAKDLCLSPVL